MLGERYGFQGRGGGYVELVHLERLKPDRLGQVVDDVDPNFYLRDLLGQRELEPLRTDL